MKLLTLLLLTLSTLAANAQPDTVTHEPFSCSLAESYPEFPGGPAVLKRFIDKRIYFPEGTEDIDGQVYIQFLISETGALQDIKVLRSLHPLLDAIAVNIIGEMPPWKPGRQDNKPVAGRYILRVPFIHR